uniref:DUF7596 domain-containing protein n=1 Tax=Acrobeloides nanus TaxID=290746 RepID=A0A914CPQ9_9BILA
MFVIKKVKNKKCWQLNVSKTLFNLVKLSKFLKIIVEESENELTPVAIGVFNHCSPNQIYCSIATLDKKYADNFVNIEQLENVDLGLKNADDAHHTCFKITEVRQNEPDLSGLPQYFSAFASREVRPLHQCIVDQLIEQTIGITNMDMKRNLTVDLYAEETLPNAELPTKLWRDYDGFIVSDKNRFAEVEIEHKKLCNLLKNEVQDKELELKFEKLEGKTFSLFLDYDSDVAIMNREEFLEWLLKLNGVNGTIALNNEMRPVGYVLSRGANLIQCYAETSDIIHHLLLKHISAMSVSTISMFLRHSDDWLGKKISSEAITFKPIRRFHSRVVPANIKWNKTFVLNIGVHIF